MANKLSLGNVSIVGPNGSVEDLGSACKPDTFHFFEKLSGYATLRFLLCRAAFLVEGDCDELVVQRAYMDSHDGRLPIQDGIEVISVGTSAKRFLELAEAVSQPVVVLTDNDGNVEKRMGQYSDYLVLEDGANANGSRIAVSFPARLLARGGIDDYSYNTLEPELFECNGLDRVNAVLGKTFKDRDGALRHMRANKTESAYKFFVTEEKVVWPPYIMDAIKFIDGVLNGK